MNKTIINLILIFVVIASFITFVYYRYFSIKETDDVVVETIVDENNYSMEVVNFLNEVNKIKIDRSIFQKKNSYLLGLGDLKHFDPEIPNRVRPGKQNIFIDGDGTGYVVSGSYSTNQESVDEEVNSDASVDNNATDESDDEGSNQDSDSENNSENDTDGDGDNSDGVKQKPLD